MKGDPTKLAFATRAIHAGQPPDPATGAVSMPIYATSTYVQDELGRGKGFDYARSVNPTRSALETNVASLEGGRVGLAFASGMAAIATLMTSVRAEEHVVLSRNVYGGTYRFMTRVLDRYNVRSSWVDTTDIDAVERAIEEKTRLIFVESPTNPMMEVSDIAAIAQLGRDRGVKVAVDNTFMTPYFQLPLALGADHVVHSTTKYLNGHSDSIGGVLVSSDEEDGEWFRFVQKSEGAILSPFDSFLTLRGLKTLAVRMEQHEKNARELALFLSEHPRVKSVLYPGLAEFPGHDLQQQQARGFGAMISIELASAADAKGLLDALEVWSLAESLGGVESLACHPATMTHASVPEKERRRLGISDGLVRLSVGIESGQDLRDDLDRALARLG